ncbi:MAG: hypothetical protein IPJ07_04710 [Acidobacteria bacterium]|nr:hypothetical protein [Acidobacteriota bacterium]
MTKTGNAPQIPLDGLASLSYTNGQGQTLTTRIVSTHAQLAKGGISQD